MSETRPRVVVQIDDSLLTKYFYGLQDTSTGRLIRDGETNRRFRFSTMQAAQKKADHLNRALQHGATIE